MTRDDEKTIDAKTIDEKPVDEKPVDGRWSVFSALTAQIASPPFAPLPKRYLSFPDIAATSFDPVHLSDKLTFLFRTLMGDRLVAWYPSPRRPVEIALPEETWPALVARNPEVEVMEPVDEALLLRRTPGLDLDTETLPSLLLPSAPCFEIISSLSTRRHLGFPHEKAETAMHDLWARAGAEAGVSESASTP